MKIILDKNVIGDLSLNNYDIATYVALKSIYNQNKPQFYISVRMLCYELFGSKIPRSALVHVRDSIHHLADYHLFDIVTTLTQDEFIIKNDKLYFDLYQKNKKQGAYFTIITLEEVQKIMSLNITSAKYPVLRFFINVIGTFDRGYGVYEDMDAKTNFVGYMTQQYIGSLSNINVGVVEDYFKILEDAHLLYVYRHGKARYVDGRLKGLANNYGRYQDKEDIVQFALAYEKSIGVNPAKQSSNANHKRAIMAKYKYILSDPNKYLQKYSEQELIAIYQYISKRNQQQKDIEKSDIKDLTVLEQVPCIIEYMKECAAYDNSDWGDYKELTNSDEEVDLETV